MPTALGIVRKFFPQVKNVEDASRNIIVEVSKKDTQISKRKNHKICAMAVACKRKYAADGVIISSSTAYIVKGDTARRYEVPVTVAREVVSFDRGGGFAEGEYHLTPPSNKLGRRITGKGHSKGGANNMKHARHQTTGIRTALNSKRLAG